MEINRKELRQTARKQLKGNWLWVIGLLIIPGIINLFLEYITNYVWTGSFNTNNLYLVSWWQGLGWSIFTIITALIATMLAWGVQYSTLAFRDTGEKPKPVTNNESITIAAAPIKTWLIFTGLPITISFAFFISIAFFCHYLYYKALSKNANIINNQGDHYEKS